MNYMTIAGSDDYMAPEVLLGEKYDEKCDVFGFVTFSSHSYFLGRVLTLFFLFTLLLQLWRPAGRYVS